MARPIDARKRTFSSRSRSDFPPAVAVVVRRPSAGKGIYREVIPIMIVPQADYYAPPGYGESERERSSPARVTRNAGVEWREGVCAKI